MVHSETPYTPPKPSHHKYHTGIQIHETLSYSSTSHSTVENQASELDFVEPSEYFDMEKPF